MFYCYVNTDHLQGTPAILTVPVLHPCLRAEQIHITVDTHTGRLRCHVPKHLDCPVIVDLERALNDDQTRLPVLVSELRYWITLRRCEKTLQHLPASPHDRLPLLHAVDHPIARIGKHKLFVRFNRHPTVILVVQITERPRNPCEMEFNFNLVFVRHSSIDDSPHTEETNGANESDIPKVYLRVQTLIEFDTFVATHGPGTCVDSEWSQAASAATAVAMGAKRRLNDPVSAGPPNKQTKNPSYFIPELAHIVNMCDEKLPFVCLAQELENRGIPHSGLQIEANASALVLKLLSLPQPPLTTTTTSTTIPSAVAAAAATTTASSSSSAGPPGGTSTTSAQATTATTATADSHRSTPPATSMPVISKSVWDSLMRRLLTVAIRAHPGVWSSELFWSVEFVFNGAPLRSTHSREQGVRRAVTSTLPGNNPTDQIAKTVDCLLDDWKRIVYLYCLVQEFVEQYRNGKWFRLTGSNYTVYKPVLHFFRETQPAPAYLHKAVQLHQFASRLRSQQRGDRQDLLVHRDIALSHDLHRRQYSGQCTLCDARTAAGTPEFGAQSGADCAHPARDIRAAVRHR